MRQAMERIYQGFNPRLHAGGDLGAVTRIRR